MNKFYVICYVGEVSKRLLFVSPNGLGYRDIRMARKFSTQEEADEYEKNHYDHESFVVVASDETDIYEIIT